MITLTTNLGDSPRNLTLADRFPEVFACMGIHPCDVQDTPDDYLPALRNFAGHPMVAAIGETGIAGTGGVRLTNNAKRHTGPDLAVGDGDALHVIYFNDNDNVIEHKRSSTDKTWLDVSSAGWDQNVDGAAVGPSV